MIARSLAFMLTAVVLTGCAHTAEPAASAHHPASPRAAEAPRPPLSTTLNTTAVQAPEAVPPAQATAAAAAAPADGDADAAPAAYTCPHHPKVMQAEAGECPFCNMKLVPTTSRQTSPLRAADPAPAAAADHSAHESHGARGTHDDHAGHGGQPK